MYSSVIGKIEKAKRYAEEKGRVTFSSFVVTFRGENDDHKVEYNDWQPDLHLRVLCRSRILQPLHGSPANAGGDALPSRSARELAGSGGLRRG